MKMLEAGKIVTTHGVRGEVRLDAWCDSPDFLLSVKTFYLEDKTPIKVEFSRVHKGRLNIKIKGYPRFSHKRSAFFRKAIDFGSEVRL